MKRFDPRDAALLVVDLQERLVPVLKKQNHLLRYTKVLIEMAKTYRMPIVFTEQYPKGLGPTLTELLDLLSAPLVISKTKFTAAVPEVKEQLKKSDKRQIVSSCKIKKQ